MKLGKLLGASMSLFSGGERVVYRLWKGPALPKFNLDRNPFAYQTPDALKPLPETQVSAQADSVQKSPPPYAFKPIRVRRAAAARPPAVIVAPVTPTLAPVPAVVRAEQPVKTAPKVEVKPARLGWVTRLNPFRAPEPAPAPAPAQRVVQTELSLETVKVVHNDLADADVELVPVKSRPDGTVTPPSLPPSRRALDFSSEKVANFE